MTAPPNDVTQILAAIESGDPEASGRLLPLVYDELRRLASQRIAGERAGQTLQATALVHEAYLRMLGSGTPGFGGRGRFFAAAAEAMRRILVDRARKRGARKRGGGMQRLDLDPDALLLDEVPAELIDLDEALKRLEQASPVAAQLVDLRFFAGLQVKEAAAALGVSRAKAERHLAFAKAWLFDALAAGDEGDGADV